MITSTDNFNSQNYVPFKFIEFDERKTYAKKEKDIIGNSLDVTLREYQLKSINNTFFSFFRDEEKRNAKNKDDLIISIKKNKKYDKVIICNKKYILSDNSANVSALYKKMSFLGRLFRTISF